MMQRAYHRMKEEWWKLTDLGISKKFKGTLGEADV